MAGTPPASSSSNYKRNRWTAADQTQKVRMHDAWHVVQVAPLVSTWQVHAVREGGVREVRRALRLPDPGVTRGGYLGELSSRRIIVSANSRIHLGEFLYASRRILVSLQDFFNVWLGAHPCIHLGEFLYSSRRITGFLQRVARRAPGALLQPTVRVERPRHTRAGGYL